MCVCAGRVASMSVYVGMRACTGLWVCLCYSAACLLGQHFPSCPNMLSLLTPSSYSCFCCPCITIHSFSCTAHSGLAWEASGERASCRKQGSRRRWVCKLESGNNKFLEVEERWLSLRRAQRFWIVLTGILMSHALVSGTSKLGSMSPTPLQPDHLCLIHFIRMCLDFF